MGTVTEIYDYLRLLWARIGVPHCPKCGRRYASRTIDQIVDQVMAGRRGRASRCWPPSCARARAEHAKVFEDARKSGYVRVRVDGNVL